MNLSPRSIPYRILENGQRLFGVILFGVISTQGTDDGLAGLGVLLGIVVFGVVVSAAWEIAYHRRFEYEMTQDTFDIRSGVLSRREREIPYERIQNVDVSQNALQRLLDVAELRLETAGGNSTEAQLSYVSRAKADELQEAVSQRKRNLTTGAADETPDAAESETLFALEDRELAILGFISADFRLLGFVAVVLSGFAPTLARTLTPRTELYLVAGPALALAAIIGLWIVNGVRSALRYYGFRLMRQDDELRYERGLLQRYNGTIPVEKIQTVTIQENPLARRLGYATLVIETAGYAGGGAQVQSAVPIAKRARVEALARAVEPVGEFALQRPPKRARSRYAIRYSLLIFAVTGVGWLLDSLTRLDVFWQALLALLVLVPLAAHLTWANRGYHVDDDHVVTRNGFWRRSTAIVPVDRVQTVLSSQTVFQRRRNLGSVVVDTAGGGGLVSGDAVAVDLDASVASDLRETVADRLQAALSASASR